MKYIFNKKMIGLIFFAVIFLLPVFFDTNFSLILFSQIGVTIIICLSYNILLGQGGMLSFGHAVYTGLGAFAAMHVMLLANSASYFKVPLYFVPLIGGVVGLFVAAIFGYFATRKSGTTFAMITLGIGELVASIVLMFPGFFGGESGIETNRAYKDILFDLNFASNLSIYYLIVSYCLICSGLIFLFTKVPLGKILNAVRDNEDRIEYIGYSAKNVRYFAFMISGFFAGIGGALSAINFESITTIDSVSMQHSASYLLFTFLGGSSVFWGPIIGAILLVLSLNLFSELTSAWMLYIGFIFIFMVMYASDGVAGILISFANIMRNNKIKNVIKSMSLLFFGFLCFVFPLVFLIEVFYYYKFNQDLNFNFVFFGYNFDPNLNLIIFDNFVLFLVGIFFAVLIGFWFFRYSILNFKFNLLKF